MYKKATFKIVQAGQFCEFAYDYTNPSGAVCREPGYVRARPISGVGPWTFHDFLPKSRPAEWGKLCKPCSNLQFRPIYHNKRGEPITTCQRVVNRPIIQPDCTGINPDVQPLPRTQRNRVNARPVRNGPAKCVLCDAVFKNPKGVNIHWRSAHKADKRDPKARYELVSPSDVQVEQKEAAAVPGEQSEADQRLPQVEHDYESDDANSDGAYGEDSDGDELYEVDT